MTETTITAIESIAKLLAPLEKLNAEAEALSRTIKSCRERIAACDPLIWAEVWDLVRSVRPEALSGVETPRLDSSQQDTSFTWNTDDIEQRKVQAKTMADEYVRHYFQTSHLARLAAQEGWFDPLRDYVNEIAWVQAQGLCQVCPIAESTWLSQTLRPCRSSDETMATYRDLIGRPVAQGAIEVTVPSFLIQEWRELLCRGRGKERRTP